MPRSRPARLRALACLGRPALAPAASAAAASAGASRRQAVRRCAASPNVLPARPRAARARPGANEPVASTISALDRFELAETAAGHRRDERILRGALVV